MPINIAKGDDIPNHHKPNQNQKQSSQDVIAKLDYVNLWQPAGKLRDDGTMRVDMQGHFPGPGGENMSNIQVQVDGMPGKSTVAHATVSSSIMTENKENQQGAVNAVISALNQSLDSGHSFLVNGTNP